MRAIDKGSVPMVGANPKSVSDYKDWRQDLIDRIGNYCCYCNMRLNDSPQVEHVVPKKPQAGQPAGEMLAWKNMLLGCGPCNRKKGNNPVSAITHYLPDFHNTHLVFDYVVKTHPQKPDRIACVPTVASGSAYVDAIKAQATIDLCGLDLITVNPRATDLRWKYRYETLLKAQAMKTEWDEWGKGIAARFIRLLIIIVGESGFFSLWLKMFSDAPEVIREIVRQIPGNHLDCFDPQSFQPIPHNLP